ncbi:hypothetical protein ACFO3J_00965 [Streptomyces polygonati]|uniref:Uncharacterized protein n=1 Tax=Streptomyces polygonati TaxID=1617087 RepID=A0ABV8HF22_9ACTN
MPVIAVDVPALKVVEEVPDRWCYAAVEQVLRKAFKKPDISQTEIAHNCFIRVAATSTTTYSHLGRMLQYAKTAVSQVTGKPLDVVEKDWLTLRPSLATLAPFGELNLDKDGLRGLLRDSWGEFDRKIFTTVNIGCPPSVFDVAPEIAEGKLVAAANDVHWYVIYGYDYDEAAVHDDEEAKYTYLVYDVHGGVASRAAAKDFNENLSEVLTVTA